MCVLKEEYEHLEDYNGIKGQGEGEEISMVTE